jgi:O-antigen ligase
VALFYLLISSMPFTEHPLFGAWVGVLTVTKYLGGLCLLYAVFLVAKRGRMPSFFNTLQARWFAAFVVLALTSFSLLGESSRLGTSPFALYFSLLLQFLITCVFVDSVRRLRDVLLAEMASIAFASLYVIREWQVYHNIYPGFRPGFVVGDSNYFAVSVVVCLPISYYLIVLPGPRWQRLFTMGCMIITLTAFMLGASRGGFLGLTVASLFVVAHSRQRLRNLVALVAIIVPLSLAVPTSPIRRLISPDYSDDEAVAARRVAWQAGLRMIKTHPMFGVGLGNFKPLSESYEDPDNVWISVAHNTYIELAAELGIPGLLLFVSVLVTSFWALRKVRNAARRVGHTFVGGAALGLQSGLIGAAVALCFVSGQVEKIFWFNIFLTMCLPAAFARACAKRPKLEHGERVDTTPSLRLQTF